MSSLPQVFASPDALERAFVTGLGRLLAADARTGHYILVLANAAMQPILWQQLEARLEECHYHLAALITTALRQGRPLAEPDDDLLVFLKLVVMGFGTAARVENRRAGPWEVSLNPLRALRPPRASARPVQGISRPFDARGFHFNLPGPRQETLWSGELLGRSVSLLYNKFPFVPLHTLLVPEPERQLPQFLPADLHQWAWEVVLELALALPGFGLAYNSYGAYASVNHLHFQAFMRASPLPVCQEHWTHNGGDTPYPARCLTFDDPLAAWAAIEDLHQQAAAYNALYQPGRMYLFPRRPQGSHPVPEWSAGPAWYELAGGMVTFSRAHYEDLGPEAIESALRMVSLH